MTLFFPFPGCRRRAGWNRRIRKSSCRDYNTPSDEWNHRLWSFPPHHLDDWVYWSDATQPSHIVLCILCCYENVAYPSYRTLYNDTAS